MVNPSVYLEKLKTLFSAISNILAPWRSKSKNSPFHLMDFKGVSICFGIILRKNSYSIRFPWNREFTRGGLWISLDQLHLSHPTSVARPNSDHFLRMRASRQWPTVNFSFLEYSFNQTR